MVGNKCDIEESKREVSYREGEKVNGWQISFVPLLILLHKYQFNKLL